MALKLLINSLFRGGAEKQFAALSALLPAESILLLENEICQPADAAKIKTLSEHRAATSSALKTAAIPLYAHRLAKLAGPGDTVLSFMERANLVNVIAARRSGHRAVICERTRPSGEFSGLRGALMRPLIKRYYPRADLVVANSQGVKKDLADNFLVPAEKIKVINNGHDTAGIAAQARVPLDAAWARVYERPVLATSGRLTPAKGQWHLLRIFREVKKTLPEAALVLVGDGELKPWLLELSRELGFKTFSGEGAPPADADVYFTGFRENPYNFIAGAGLFVFTSLWEGFPNALTEAMACGIPVMSADCSSGPREILAPATPFFTRTNAPEKAPYGLLMPVLSGRRLAAARPEPEELAWAGEICAALADKKALEAYARAGLVRAGDFALSKTAALWKEIVTR
ncbi:MAG: hypothetical protein A2X35_11280 [Elusimicrobia bacterium GWA2_61_42]|nr:MAG: hypothetical protein A2X35_11280 [Elusimicrobia bacterium GWA2_61_42]OGR75878.1 MAG: hypothetical protein A2X38_07635 [Elusimicrobia bacterium GWC2_61_25]